MIRDRGQPIAAVQCIAQDAPIGSHPSGRHQVVETVAVQVIGQVALIDAWLDGEGMGARAIVDALEIGEIEQIALVMDRQRRAVSEISAPGDGPQLPTLPVSPLQNSGDG